MTLGFFPRRRVLRACAVLAPVVLLAACAGIPDQGPVVPGRQVSSADPRDGVYQVVASGPRTGDDPAQTVQGFLRAAGAFTDDHATARSFLAPDRRTAWRPDDSTTVYTGRAVEDLTVAQTASGTQAPAGMMLADAGNRASDAAPRGEFATIRVSVPVEATVDLAGRYAVAPLGKVRTLTFQLLKVGGQWRIGALPDGIVISHSDFGFTYRAFPIYYPDPRGAYLVPDLRWFPALKETSTALVRALLAGPSPELEPAVTTGAPKGTKLGVAAVVVADEVATVDLTRDVRAATPRQRWLLEAQISNTLGQLRGISSVALTLNGGKLDISREAGIRSRAQVDPPVDGRPVVIRADGTVARIRNNVAEPVEGVEGLQRPGVSHPAVSPVDGRTLAVLGADGDDVLVQTAGQEALPEPALSGRDLTAPSFDPDGWVWSSPAESDGLLLAAVPGRDALEVPAPQLKGHEVVAMRISRDGARALIALRTGTDRAEVLVSPIRRDGEGRPLGVGDGLRLIPDLTSVRDVSWAGESSVAVLGTRAGAPERVMSVQVGGTLEDLPVSQGITSVAAGNGAPDMYAGTSGGQLLVRSAQKWSVGGDGDGRWPAFPG